MKLERQSWRIPKNSFAPALGAIGGGMMGLGLKLLVPELVKVWEDCEFKEEIEQVLGEIDREILETIIKTVVELKVKRR